MFSNMDSIQMVEDDENFYKSGHSPQSQKDNLASRSKSSYGNASGAGKKSGQNPSMER